MNVSCPNNDTYMMNDSCFESANLLPLEKKYTTNAAARNTK